MPHPATIDLLNWSTRNQRLWQELKVGANNPKTHTTSQRCMRAWYVWTVMRIQKWFYGGLWDGKHHITAVYIRSTHPHPYWTFIVSRFSYFIQSHSRLRCWTCIWTRPSTFVPTTNATCQFVLLTNRCRRCHCHSRRCHCRPISIDRLAPAYASIRWIQMAAINELLQHLWMDLTPAPVSQSLGLYRVGQKRRPTGKRETTNAAFRAIQAVEPYFIKDGSCAMMIYHSSQLGANCFANTKPTQAANVLNI